MSMNVLWRTCIARAHTRPGRHRLEEIGTVISMKLVIIIVKSCQLCYGCNSRSLLPSDCWLLSLLEFFRWLAAQLLRLWPACAEFLTQLSRRLVLFSFCSLLLFGENCEHHALQCQEIVLDHIVMLWEIIDLFLVL